MKIFLKRPLYIQVLFTFLAFTAMVILSYFFMRDIIHANLVRNTESVFSFAQYQLEADLIEPKMMLSGYSQTIRSMLLRGDSFDNVKGYISDISIYFHSGDFHLMRSVLLLGVFYTFGEEPVLLVSDEIPKGENYIPSDMMWYQMAEASSGQVIETPPYISQFSGNKVITFARRIYDNDDNRIAIIALEVDIYQIGQNIINIASENGGYGFLISQDFVILDHANREFVGRSLSDKSVPISALYNDMKAGNAIKEYSMSNWRGEKIIAFVQKASNGWYLGFLAQEKPFYYNLTYMANILVFLGIFFAAILIVILVRIDFERSKSSMESKHKSAFLANMSHEIRTPMNAIIGMTAIGKSSSGIDQKDRCFSKIEDASNHLLGVINDILDMSKIEANKFDLSPAEFNFEKMIQRIVNVINFRIEERRQNFTVHIDRQIPKTLIGDDHRIAQVITNLLGNAIKFTPEGGAIRLDARCLEEKDNIFRLQITVSDNGIGMTEEQLSRIFTSFEQAESSTTRKYGGTGLGLPISKSIAEMMGGSINVESVINKGSSFKFVFNLRRGVQLYQGLLPPDINLKNVRVMAVDDDKEILDYFLEISREINIQCDVAVSGEDAIKLVEKNGHYHIYFIDWKMPGMDGIQLTAELKARHEPVKSVVIMITSAEWKTVEKEAREAGVDKFLSKPLFPSNIADIINEALGVNYGHDEETRKDITGMFLGRRLLLADDVDVNREIVKALLEPTGIDIVCVENGKEALNKFTSETRKFDVIFMDVQMPEMDGYEATRRIRALNVPQAKTTRIIAMTANVFREDIEKCIEAGMDNHIGKPVILDEIIDKLRLYLPDKKSAK
ncbi:MAG: response regulator [Treponema sp.]|nr:response regulator [Treponema sp.]